MMASSKVTYVHVSPELVHRMGNNSLISVLAQMNDCAIERMKAGAYEKANAILVDALGFVESKGGNPTQLIDPLTFPLQLPEISNWPFGPPINASTLYGSPCGHAPATILSYGPTRGTRRPGVYVLPVSHSFRSGSGTVFRNGTMYSFSSSVRRQRLTVRLPEPEVSMIQQTAIYCRAFVLDKNSCNLRIAAAILTYNAALCAHLHAAVTGSSTVAPHRALCLYSAAYSSILAEQKAQTLDWLLLQGRASAGGNCRWLWNEQARTIVLLQAALCHNMAAIHGDFFWNLAHARLLRCQLAAIIHWTAFSQMETEDFVFFHLGIFFALIDDFRLAPAA